MVRHYIIIEIEILHKLYGKTKCKFKHSSNCRLSNLFLENHKSTNSALKSIIWSKKDNNLQKVFGSQTISNTENV